MDLDTRLIIFTLIGCVAGGCIGLVVGGILASSKIRGLLDEIHKLTVWNQKLRHKLYGGKDG